MAFTTAVNRDITDAVADTNVIALGDAPAIAMGELYLATSQALANAAHNATHAQQQGYVTSQASTVVGLGALYSLVLGADVESLKIYDVPVRGL